MKRLIFSMFFAVMAVVAVNAQQIAVVSGSGATSVYQTLAKAIEEADPGSTIYLPGGGFQISDDVKITKRLYIIGIGHKAVSENADGNTVISGNLFFNENSDGSAVMGCYISGTVYIGYDNLSVNNILIKLCNISRISIKSNLCTGTRISHNYIRDYSCNLGGAEATITNNIMTGIRVMSGGIVKNNIFVSGGYVSHGSVVGDITFDDVHNSTICDNIMLKTYVEPNDNYNGHTKNSDNIIYGNMFRGEWGEKAINVSAEWTDVFADYNNGAVSPASNFRFKGDYQQYEGEVGIYGGTEPFSDSALPPVPYIVSKVIPEQTDASGKLNIKIRVKAGE